MEEKLNQIENKAYVLENIIYDASKRVDTLIKIQEELNCKINLFEETSLSKKSIANLILKLNLLLEKNS